MADCLATKLMDGEGLGKDHACYLVKGHRRLPGKTRRYHRCLCGKRWTDAIYKRRKKRRA